MRPLWLLAVFALAGCGGTDTASPTAKSLEPARGRCAAAAAGFELCGQPAGTGAHPPSAIIRRDRVVAEPLGPVGHWSRLFVSPDGGTLLAQWIAECEIPIAFFVSVRGGGARAVTGERDWAKSPETEALGWRGGRALVRMPERGETASPKPGVYLIDSKTFRRTLVRPLRGRLGC